MKRVARMDDRIMCVFFSVIEDTGPPLPVPLPQGERGLLSF